MGQGKRGMMLERIIEITNQTYKNKGWALVDKIPTPWAVHYNRQSGKVAKAFPKEKGTVDFIGLSHGKSIAFDAKSTNTRTSFPLKNIQPHQLNYLSQHQDQGGLSFILVEFAKQREIYLLTIDQLNEWWEQMEAGGRKSIPYDYFLNHCDRVQARNGVPADYISLCGTVK